MAKSLSVSAAAEATEAESKPEVPVVATPTAPVPATPMESFEAWARSLGLMRAQALDSTRNRLVQNLMPLTMERIPYLGSMLHLAERLEREAEAVQQSLPASCPEVDLIAMISPPSATPSERLRAVKGRLCDQRYQLQLLDERIATQAAEEENRLAADALSLAAGAAQTKGATTVDAAMHQQRARFAAAVQKLSRAQDRAARDLLVKNLQEEASELRTHVKERMEVIRATIRDMAFLIVSATLAVGVPRDLVSLKESYSTHDELREFVLGIPDVPGIVTDEKMMGRSQRSVDAKIQEIMESA